jgi:hypothetical protein
MLYSARVVVPGLTPAGAALSTRIPRFRPGARPDVEVRCLQRMRTCTYREWF